MLKFTHSLLKLYNDKIIKGTRSSKVLEITSGSKSYTLSKNAYTIIECGCYGFSDVGVKIALSSTSSPWLAHLANNADRWIATITPIYLLKGTTLTASLSLASGTNGVVSIIIYDY